jgi:integrase
MSLQTTDKSKAQEYHDKYKAGLWDIYYLNTEKPMTWPEAVERWAEEKSHKKSLHRDLLMANYLSKHFKDTALDDLDITGALLAKKQEGVSPTTINRYTALIKSILRKAKSSWGQDITLPNLPLTPEKPRELYLTVNEYKALLRNLPDKLRDVVAFAIETGLRKSNILGIQSSSVDLDRKVLHVHSQTTKSGKPFSIPLSDQALDLLKRNNYSFRFGATEYRRFKQAALLIDKSGLRFHDLRHTYASWKAQAGVPIEVISKLLGHSSIVVTDRYRHLSINNLREYV